MGGAGLFGSLTPEVWAGGLVFLRVGALVMLMPGVGESAVPPRVRLGFSLLLSLVLTPIVMPTLPAIPNDVGGMAAQGIREVLVGLVIGAVLRMFLAALATAGEVVSLQTTLSFSQTANPLQAQPGTTLATFLGLFGVVLIFAADLHHGFIGAVAGSYRLFPVGGGIPVQDAGALAVRVAGDAFSVGIQLAAPVIVFALIFNVATGFVARAMPQFQVFFAATPLAVLLGLSVFTLSLGGVGLVFVDRYRELIGRFT